MDTQAGLGIIQEGKLDDELADFVSHIRCLLLGSSD